MLARQSVVSSTVQEPRKATTSLRPFHGESPLSFFRQRERISQLYRMKRGCKNDTYKSPHTVADEDLLDPRVLAH